ncbi:MAG TPA: EamA family transporter RarD [Caulobacteraceae bacterium]
MSPGTSGGVARQALVAGFFCYLIWGAIPILFIVMGRAGASPWEILAQRALWSAPWAGLLVVLAGQGAQVRKVFASPRRLALLTVSAAMISSGWAVYVWSVNNGRNIEASLGYYVTPLLNMAAGAAFFRERIDRFGMVAIALAATGVALQWAALGHLPIIALYLAATFWGYGLIRRQIDIDAQTGLFVECLLMVAPGLAYVIWLHHSGGGVFTRTTGQTLLMLTAGPATVAPLALFAWTARRLPFATIGFLQFISPTIGFMVGLVMGERLNGMGVASFAFIWTGAAVYVAGAWRASMRMQVAT